MNDSPHLFGWSVLLSFIYAHYAFTLYLKFVFAIPTKIIVFLFGFILTSRFYRVSVIESGRKCCSNCTLRHQNVKETTWNRLGKWRQGSRRRLTSRPLHPQCSPLPWLGSERIQSPPTKVTCAIISVNAYLWHTHRCCVFVYFILHVSDQIRKLIADALDKVRIFDNSLCPTHSMWL